jgi:hypothetical protein
MDEAPLEQRLSPVSDATEFEFDVQEEPKGYSRVLSAWIP